MDLTQVTHDPVVQFFQWMEGTAKNIGLKIALHREYREHWPEVTAARAFFNFRGQRVEGMGFGASDEQAIIVAVAELVERSCLLASTTGVISSNGFAVHTDRQLAERNAVYELLERDAYLCHHLTETPFSSLSEQQLAHVASPSLQRLLVFAKSSGLSLNVGIMRAIGDGYGYILALDGHRFSPSFGAIVSLAYDNAPDFAIERCARSALASLVYRMCSGVWQSLNVHEFGATLNPTPEDHGQYALYDDKLEWFQKSFVMRENTTLDKSWPQVRLHSLRIPDELGHPPLFACRAVSKDVQNLFFGFPKAEDINLKRLEGFLGRKIALDEVLMTQAHMLD